MSRLLKRLLAATAVVGALSIPALVGSLSGPANAQQPAAGDERLGKALESLVDVLDANKDGTIDRHEIEMASGKSSASGDEADDRKPGRDFLSNRDADNDGSISRAEFLSGPEARFAKLDVNGDGKLDESERKAAREEWRDKREERQKRRADRRDGDGWRPDRDRHHGPDHRDMGDRGDRGDRAERLFERFDRDDDGVITREEVETRRGRWQERHGEDRG